MKVSAASGRLVASDDAFVIRNHGAEAMRRSCFLTAAAAAALSLAACGSERAPETNVAANDVVAAPAPSPAPQVNSSNPAAPGASVIPEVLRGRWGLTAEDCTSTRGDAKGLLEIGDTQLRFYESRATLRTITEQSDSRIAAEFDFEGEGQTWQRLVILDSEDGGRTLNRREAGADAMDGTLTYRKCGN